MSTKLTIDNLPSNITADRLEAVFAQIGEVQSVTIKTDLFTSKPTGSGTVDMSLDVDAFRAVNCFSGATFRDRKLHVEVAYPLYEKAKSVLGHIADGSALAGFGRWKDRHLGH